MLRGKDSRNFLGNNDASSIRGNRSNLKRVPSSYNSNQNRSKSNNRSHLKERIKTIEYSESAFNTIATRSNTVQKRRKLPTHEAASNPVKPYSNFIPSSNTRSNITIDRSGSLGYGKLKSTLQNPSSISQITENNKSDSRKMIVPINEYEDDSTLVINSNSFTKKSNLNTIVAIKHNNDWNLTINTYKNKNSSKELVSRPKFTKVTKKDNLRSKSNKRTTKEDFERVYLQSPWKMIGRKTNGLNKSKNKIMGNDSENSLLSKQVNLRDNSVSPHVPKVADVISEDPRHKTAIKKRSIQNFNNSLKHEESSITNSKDNCWGIISPTFALLN